MCKKSRQAHEELTEKQKRLDARGNDVVTTNLESDWALGLVRGISESDTELLHDHVESLGRRYDSDGGRELVRRLGLAPEAKRDPLAITKLLADQDAGFKALIDDVPRALPRDVNTWYDQLCREPDKTFLEMDRGRVGPRRIRPRQAFSPHGGITTGPGRSAEQEGLYDKDIRHGHAMFRVQLGGSATDESDIARRFQQQGAPFVGGASGTLRAVILDLEAQARRETLTDDERAKREKLLAMHSVMMVVHGHHSLSECLLQAQGMGWFTDLPSPLVDYEGAMKAWQQRLRRLGLRTDAPLTKDQQDEGKSRGQLDWEARRHNFFVLWDRFESQVPADVKREIQRHLRDADAAASHRRWREAIDELGDARSQLDFQVSVIRRNASGAPSLLTGEDLVARFKGRRPHKDKKKSVAYKETREALDAYQEAWKELSGTRLDTDFSFNAFNELRARLQGVITGAEAYLAKHGTARKKADEVAAMRQVIEEARAELRLLAAAETTRTARFEDALTLASAVDYARYGVDVERHIDPRTLSDDKLQRRRFFGAGGVNSVQEIVWTGDPADEVRIWKPEEKSLDRLPEGVMETGIAPDNPRFGQRNVATRLVAEKLGLGDLVPKAHFARVDGRVGLAMTKAPGTSFQVDVDTPVTPPIPPEDRWKRFRIRRRAEDGVLVYSRTTPNPLPIEQDEAVDLSFMKQLIDLQWLDAFCAQTDRHDQNYLVDIQGGRVTVTGIDNDFSFGKHMQGVEQLEASEHHPGGRPSNLGLQYCGLPPLIDGALYDHLQTVTFAAFEGSRDDPEPPHDLKQLLFGSELEAAKRRFEQLKRHAGTLNDEGKVVRDWRAFRVGDPAKSAKEFLLGDTAGPSYYKRDLLKNRQRGGT